jgi:hypothetical protein
MFLGEALWMIRADSATVNWDSGKKAWQVRLKIGEEVIKRACKVSQDTADERLRSLALETARDEGYELDSAHIVVTR